MKEKIREIPGRGTGLNPPNRFEPWHRIPEEDEPEGFEPHPETRFISDGSRSIISNNQSPDVPFESGLNPYRGCEHGCSYCYARPTHEYLGFSSGIDFETKILVKENAPGLLRTALRGSRWRPRVLALSGVTDPYQPAERRLRLTRRCLEVLAEFRNPVCVITKNALVARDLDLFKTLAGFQAVAVLISIPTLDSRLSGLLEPRASRPLRRLQAIRSLSREGIPTGVLLAPVIPGLTDTEIPNILRASVREGARFARMVPLRLPHSVAEIFTRWLDQNVPLKKKKILNRIRDMREGGLNDSQFGSRMTGTGPFAEQMAQIFRLACKKEGIPNAAPNLSSHAFRRAPESQIALFPVQSKNR